MSARDCLDQWLDFVYDEDDGDEDSDDDYERGRGQAAAAAYTSNKEVKVFSMMRSALMNNQLLVALVALCLICSFILAFVRVSMKDTAVHQTIFSDQLHDSVVNKHRLPDSLNAVPQLLSESHLIPDASIAQSMSVHTEKPTRIRKGSIDRVFKTGQPIRESEPLRAYRSWEGCVVEMPSPDLRTHIVQPPSGSVTLVCCNTTKGVMTMEVHPAWAPIGAERFLDMVREGFFSTKVPLFRAMKGFLVQFGLAGQPEMQRTFDRKGLLKDDLSWLPLGPTGREMNGVKRYQRGYLGYAGAGKDSRGTQLIMAFADNLYLGGGSPWEVPFGQVLGEQSLKVMSQIYTGYGEKPSQGKIMNRGAQYTEEEFPLLDSILGCAIVREGVPWDFHGHVGNESFGHR